jgi:hypothetical protein
MHVPKALEVPHIKTILRRDANGEAASYVDFAVLEMHYRVCVETPKTIYRPIRFS